MARALPGAEPVVLCITGSIWKELDADERAEFLFFFLGGRGGRGGYVYTDESNDELILPTLSPDNNAYISSDCIRVFTILLHSIQLILFAWHNE